MLEKRRLARAGWLAPLFGLLAVGLGVWIVFASPFALLGIVLAGLVLVPVIWVLISTLWPARAERTCPACGAPSLARLERDSTYGLRCRSCNWQDESASSWLFAEEEGPLEELVLAQRARAARTVDRSGRPG